MFLVKILEMEREGDRDRQRQKQARGPLFVTLFEEFSVPAEAKPCSLDS